MRRNKEEFQEIARPEKMGSVVLERIVQGFPVHGWMVSNAKGIVEFKDVFPREIFYAQKLALRSKEMARKRRFFRIRCYAKQVCF